MSDLRNRVGDLLECLDGPDPREWVDLDTVRELALAYLALAAHPAPAADDAGRADGWRPIETAPKDGTHILCWRETKIGTNVDEAWWRKPSTGGDCCWGGNSWSYPIWQQPSHWQPLPAPPPATGPAKG